MRNSTLLAVALLGASLSACAGVNEAVKGPQLTAASPQAMAASMNPGAMGPGTAGQASPTAVATANSLWRPGARAFFIDQRASRVGDILTVAITIDDSAQLSNSTDASRTNSTNGGVSHFFGLEGTLGKLLPAGYDPSKMIDQSGSTSSAGAGSVKRQEKISLTIAAVVTGVLPNGNLVIQGRQEVKANNEVRELTVGGIVRPEDITSSNTIRHTQIAEARISYGGRGDISVVQKTPAGQALLQKYSPF